MTLCSCPPQKCLVVAVPDNCAAMAARRKLLANENQVSVDRGALTMALHILRRDGNLEVAAVLQDSASVPP